MLGVQNGYSRFLFLLQPYHMKRKIQSDQRYKEYSGIGSCLFRYRPTSILLKIIKFNRMVRDKPSTFYPAYILIATISIKCFLVEITKITACL